MAHGMNENHVKLTRGGAVEPLSALSPVPCSGPNRSELEICRGAMIQAGMRAKRHLGPGRPDPDPAHNRKILAPLSRNATLSAGQPGGRSKGASRSELPAQGDAVSQMARRELTGRDGRSPETGIAPVQNQHGVLRTLGRMSLMLAAGSLVGSTLGAAGIVSPALLGLFKAGHGVGAVVMTSRLIRDGEPRPIVSGSRQGNRRS